MKKIEITGIENGSIAQELGIAKGDYLISVNDMPVKDVFDYRYLMFDEYVEVLIEKGNSLQLYEIEKYENEDIGLIFASGLMDKQRKCNNNCIFCFIDQLPEKMRKTLYFKDDDIRLSFLQGNYVTLTNLTKKEAERIAFYNLSPLKISVHAIEPELREFMLNNKKGSESLGFLEYFYNEDIEMHFQIVLCKSVNDGEHLDKTIEALSKYGRSLSVVPVGLTKHRQGLYPLKPFTKEDCKNIINQIKGWQEKFLEEYESAFVFAADEFYLKAEEPIPPYAHYEDFLQIENGVGMLAMFKKEFYDALDHLNVLPHKKTISIVTGEGAYNLIKELSNILMEKLPSLKLQVFCVKNQFFGENITVSGLLTGTDIINELKDKPLGDLLLLPQNALRSGETVFLDDITIKELSQKLNIKTEAVPIDGGDFVKAVRKENF